jgi:hypothetical protein
MNVSAQKGIGMGWKEKSMAPNANCMAREASGSTRGKE